MYDSTPSILVKKVVSVGMRVGEGGQFESFIFFVVRSLDGLQPQQQKEDMF